MNVKEGWEPLCKFLGEEVPGWEFPVANSSEEWCRNYGEMNSLIDRVAYWNAVKKVGPVVVGVLGFVAGVYVLRM